MKVVGSRPNAMKTAFPIAIESTTIDVLMGFDQLHVGKQIRTVALLLRKKNRKYASDSEHLWKPHNDPVAYLIENRLYF